MSSPPDQRLQIEIHPAADHVRVRAEGELDLETGRALQTRVAEERGARDLVLDFADVRFVDSAGLRVLIALRQQAAREGWWMTIVPSGPLRKLLDMTGTAPQFDLTDSAP